jgi:hypothetical protein
MRKSKLAFVVALSVIAISAAAIAQVLIGRARKADNIRSSASLKESFSATEPCPNMLIKRGNKIVMYNRDGTISRMFEDIDEYIAFVESQRKQGIKCPVLFLQQETDVQGNDVLRARPSPTDMAAGARITPAHSSTLTMSSAANPNAYVPTAKDSSYAPFDAHGFDVGRITALDEVHASTETNTGECSENQMDSNWCGVAFTATAISNGKYADNEIYKPIYSSANIKH